MKELLSAEPSNASYLNDYGIITYWRQDANSRDNGKHNAAMTLFQKAASGGSLSGVYNLSMLQIDDGKTEAGMKGLIEYVKKDSFSPWAKHVFALFEQKNVPVGNPITPSGPTVTNILGVKLGATPDKVTKVIGKPDRIESSKTSAQDLGQVFWYGTSGICVVFSEGNVDFVSVFAPTRVDQSSLESSYIPQPEVAGVAIGRRVDDLRKILGEPVSVRTDSRTGDTLYYYVSDATLLVFWIRSSFVNEITFLKAPRAS